MTADLVINEPENGESMPLLHVELRAGELDGEELDSATRQVRTALLHLGMTGDKVHLANDRDAPEDTRAGSTLAIGELVVSMVNSAGLLAAIVAVIQSRLGGVGPRSARLELDGDVIEVNGISSAQQQELIAQWVHRQRGQR
jgi:hypothetical protein